MAGVRPKIRLMVRQLEYLPVCDEHVRSAALGAHLGALGVRFAAALVATRQVAGEIDDLSRSRGRLAACGLVRPDPPSALSGVPVAAKTQERLCASV